MSRLLKPLPGDVRQLIRQYASDKTLHRKHEADLIGALTFRTSESLLDNYLYTGVSATSPTYFINENWLSHNLRFLHNQFDERNFPQHFDISLVWDNLRQQDEIEPMGREDARLYPEGMPESDKPHGWGWLSY